MQYRFVFKGNEVSARNYSIPTREEDYLSDSNSDARHSGCVSLSLLSSYILRQFGQRKHILLGKCLSASLLSHKRFFSKVEIIVILDNYL